MAVINMHTAKSQLSDLVKRASAGEEILVARDGKPAVRLVPVDTRMPRREFGIFAGMIRMLESYFDDLPS